MSDKIWKHDYVAFCIEILLTAIVFVIIALIAFGLQMLITWLQDQGASNFVTKALTYAEYTILVGDLIYLAIAVTKHIIMFAKKCVDDIKGR